MLEPSLTICLLLVYFVSASGCHCFDLLHLNTGRFHRPVDVAKGDNVSKDHKEFVHIKLYMCTAFMRSGSKQKIFLCG